MIDADRALAFMGWVRNRHRIWERRQAGLPQETWTDDPILASHKFTNVFRILDPGTQFVMTDLIEDISPRDQLARLFLYRHTNLPAPWQFYALVHGYPLHSDLEQLLQVWKEYRGTVTTTAVKPGSDPRNRTRTTSTSFQRKIFSGAYMIWPQSPVKGTDKVESVIRLTQRLFDPNSPDDVVPDFLRAGTQSERFAALRRNKGVADFMSMQILTDWGYTPQCGEDRENDFVVLGPGAVKGARAIDPSSSPDKTWRWVLDAVWNSGSPSLNGRLPSYMDVQNCLCEFSKYVRFEQKPGSGKPYRAAHPGKQPAPVLPAHW